ncbi:glycogen/starch/alpha-glucan phosphorylase [PVC group bacterium]|nr:glycogen/starch/alpha-glucan phosphorylase [PVC group bacterium]
MKKIQHKKIPLEAHKNDPKSIAASFLYNLEQKLAKDEYSATELDCFLALAYTIRDRLVSNWIKTQQSYHHKNVKRVYYFSFEYLIGKTLGNSLLNLGLEEACDRAMKLLDLDVDQLRDVEVDAALGNGGLGRLAACFLDSMATLGIPSHAYGIRYEYGMFNQEIQNGWQVEKPEEWLKFSNPWEIARPEYTYRVKFYGTTRCEKRKNGTWEFFWENTDDVYALPYDTPIPGYATKNVNTMRLWAAVATEEFDMDYFNSGDYMAACEKKAMTENISRVLYPNDSIFAGRELRLKQQYFFVTASLQDILRRFKVENKHLKYFPDKAVIQLNDTHPAVAIPELMRILMDQEGLSWNQAWDITTRTFAYTNHTILSEALEAWSIPLFERLLPRHMSIIYEINHRFLKEVLKQYPGDIERIRRMSLIEEEDPKRIRMAHLSIVGSRSINGVSELHTKILKEKTFHDFYQLYPERFNNKTNGITQRRWLKKSNPRLADLITGKIGDKWISDLSCLKKISKYADNKSFHKEWQKIKYANKKSLADTIYDMLSIRVDPNSLFDVQIKRFHEYKRQLLFAFYAIGMYIRIKESHISIETPRTLIVAGKSAPGYTFAKLVIKLINNIALVINQDPDVRDLLKVVFLPNYRVSLAEKIFPAAELSEQISTAGFEASGTGNMKFALNGALTIGTLDGANIEIQEEVGEENIFIFGHTAEEIEGLKSKGYQPEGFLNDSPLLQEVLKLIQGDLFCPGEPGIFQPIADRCTHHGDPYMVLADFDKYISCQERVSKAYQDKASWTRMSIQNVAHMGKFSSDRTIREYAHDIWHVKPSPVSK